MSYEIVNVTDLDGTFLGYAVWKNGTQKLEDPHLYVEQDAEKLRDRVQQLNDEEDLRSFWPDARDPEVLSLLDDPEFHPIRYSADQEPLNEDGQVDYSVAIKRIDHACKIVAQERKDAA